jgi:hypothetical protein
VPESAASRYRAGLDIRVVQLKDDWAQRHMHICVRSFDLLPGFARELVELLRQDAASSHGGP